MLDELMTRFLPQFEQSQERLLAIRSRNSALSDDEWWENALKRAFDRDPAYAERMKPLKDQMLRQRRETDAAIAQTSPLDLARRRAEEVLPTLLKVRRLGRAKGSVTDRQFDAACLGAELAKIAWMRKKIAQAAKETHDPRRKRILSMLSDNVLIDSKALKGFARTDATEERVGEVATGIASRFEALTDALADEEGQNGV